MRMPFCALLAAFALCCATVSCTSETEELKLESPADYLPLQTGKYITYRLDSLVFTQAGRGQEIRYYQEKHLIDAVITDAIGRPTYRIYRFLRDSAGVKQWQSAGTYFITPLANSIEVTEDNMRIVRLAAPLTMGSSWRGNQFLASDPYSPLYEFNNDNSIALWDFTVTQKNETFSLNGQTIPNVLTITRIDESNEPDTVVVSGNKASIAAGSKTVLIKGQATDLITIAAPLPGIGAQLAVYNTTTESATLNSFVIPPQKGRIFENLNGRWAYNYRDTIGQRDSLLSGLPYAAKLYAVDKYAKNLGLVFQQLTLWEFEPNYNPNDNGANSPYKLGFGIKRSMIDHN